MFRDKKEWLFYILGALACMNFLGRGPVVFLVFCIYGIWYFRKNFTCNYTVDYKIVPFVILSVSAFIAASIFFGIKDAIKPINFVLSYLLGCYVSIYSVDRKQTIIRLTVCLGIGFLCNLALTYYMNFIVLGHEPGIRTLINVWTNEPIPSTLIGLLSAFIIGISYYFIFVRGTFIVKAVCIIGLLLTLFVNNQTATRTPFLLIILTFFVLLYCRYDNRFFIVAPLVLLIGYVTISLNLFGLSDIISNSVVFERIDDKGFETARTDIFNKYLSLMWDYPWGGNYGEMIVGYLPHNSIQEVQNSYGIIAFLMMLIIYFRIGLLLLKYVRKARYDEINYLIIGLLTTIILQTLLEPVNSGYPQLLWVLFVYYGFAYSNYNISYEKINTIS